jgi:hypothetical protein
LSRIAGFAKRHPVGSAALAAGVAWFAGAELLAAAVVGGIVGRAFGRKAPPPDGSGSPPSAGGG